MSKKYDEEWYEANKENIDNLKIFCKGFKDQIELNRKKGKDKLINTVTYTGTDETTEYVLLLVAAEITKLRDFNYWLYRRIEDYEK